MESTRRKREPSPEWLRRRINAARELAEPTEDELRRRSPHRERGAAYGISVEELGARINRDGFGHKVIGMVRRGERDIRDYELEWIAEACGLPLEFFSVDFARLPEMPEESGVDRLLDQLGTLESAMADIREQITQLGAFGAPAIPGATGRELQADPPKRASHQRRGKTAEEG